MRKKTATYIVLAALVCVLMFVIGMRAGLHDHIILLEDEMTAQAQSYEAEIARLRDELEAEKQIEHVVYEHEYYPLAVDYEIALEPEESDIVLLAQMGIGEDTRIDLHPERVAAAYETVFNRVDNPDPYFPDTIAGVIKQPNAYQGWSADKPVDERYYKLALDCWYRWQLAKLGVGDAGLVILENCLSFAGDGEKNTFRLTDGTEWGFTMRNPYKEMEIK